MEIGRATSEVAESDGKWAVAGVWGMSDSDPELEDMSDVVMVLMFCAGYSQGKGGVMRYLYWGRFDRLAPMVHGW